MLILFDIFIPNPEMVNELKPEESIVLEEMFLFVEERIKVLKDQIDKEEQEEGAKATIIYLVSKAIQPRGYSHQLCDKIVSCFSPEDVEAMWLRVEKALQQFLN